MKKTLFIPFLMAGFTTIAIAEEDNNNNIPSGQCEEAPMMPHFQHFTPPPMPAWAKQRMAQRQMRMPAPRFQQWRNPPMRPRFNNMNMPMQRPMMPRMPVRPAYYGRPVYSNNGWGNGYGAGNGRGYGNGSGNMDGNFNFGFNGKAQGQGNGNADANANTTANAEAQNNVEGNASSQTTTNQAVQPAITTAPAPAIEKVAPVSAPAPVVIEEAPIVLTDTDKDSIVDVADLCPNTAAGMKVDAFGCDKSASIVLRGVNFKTNSDELTTDSTQLLDIVVATLIANSGLALELVGHTDSDGEAAYNKDLSQRRAARVLTYFAEHDVDVSKMKASGFGEEKPIASNDTAEGKAMNRRVEVNRL